MMTKTFTAILFGSLLFYACGSRQIDLSHDLVIRESVSIRPDTFRLDGSESLEHPVITIEGDGITVDFNGAVLAGSIGKKTPDQFYGTAILIKGKNVTLKNATVRGFKVAVMAQGADSLRLLDCNLSYNYRQRLKSYREREDFSDWLSYHNNEKDEWLRYGAAVYLKNCNYALVRGVTVTGGMNGLMLTGCNDGLFYNNTIHFNSGVGIGLYRSSRNRVMHNRLDWNVRGYSHGFYQRGQDSAALLVYEQSNENTFAYNSATHSGDGFFLWAGQSTMDIGEGGCNDNLLFRNDFSYAPTNGVEVTFSRNKIVANKMDECTYGIWGGYSYESLMLGNHIEGCRYGIAVEHGQDNAIVGNEFRNDSVGVQLWARENQPADWGYAQKRDVRSRNYAIEKNRFEGVKSPLKISSTKKASINDDNQFSGFEKLLVAEKPNEEFFFVKNDVHGTEGWQDAASFKDLNRTVSQLPDFQIPMSEIERYAVPKLPEGMDASLPPEQLKGRQYILVDEWGPYDFRSPSVWLRTIEGDTYTFLIAGPAGGNWKLVSGEAWAKVNQFTGTFPATVVATKKSHAEYLTLNFEYIGDAFTDRFGNFHKKGEVVPFGFERYEKKLPWKVSWYNYTDETDPLLHFDEFSTLKKKPPVSSTTTDELAFAWWGNPAEGVSADRFATFAETTFDIEPGTYRLRVTSDDGMKFYLDGWQKMSNWGVHEAQTEELTLGLGGRHHIEIIHFDNGGLATIDFRLEPVK
jgi:parallel beta-helix repeat protein